MALFLSTTINKLDKKGRVSVPALFRQALGAHRGEADFQGVVIFPSFKHAALEGCTLARMEQLSHSVDQFDQFSDAYDAMSATIFADAHQLAFDNEGRIMLPPALLHHAHITENVAFVGRGASFQLWNPADFHAYQATARANIVAGKATLTLHHPAKGGHS